MSKWCSFLFCLQILGNDRTRRQHTALHIQICLTLLNYLKTTPILAKYMYQANISYNKSPSVHNMWNMRGKDVDFWRTCGSTRFLCPIHLIVLPVISTIYTHLKHMNIMPNTYKFLSSCIKAQN